MKRITITIVTLAKDTTQNTPKHQDLGGFSKTNDITPPNAKFEQQNTSNHSYDWNNWSRGEGTGAKFEAQRGRTSSSRAHPI
jgi:hypothetical protein